MECPSCKGTDIVVDDELFVTVCTQCGQMIEGAALDEQPEFNAAPVQNRMRRFSHDAEGRLQQEKLTAERRAERYMHLAFHCSTYQSELYSTLHNLVPFHAWGRRVWVDKVIACCLLLLARKYNLGKSFDDIAAVIPNMTPIMIYRTLGFIKDQCHDLHGPTALTTVPVPVLIMRAIQHAIIKAILDDDEHKVAAVRTLAYEIFNATEHLGWVACGRKPQTVAGACLYWALRMGPYPADAIKSFEALIVALPISRLTLRKRCSEVRCVLFTIVHRTLSNSISLMNMLHVLPIVLKYLPQLVHLAKDPARATSTVAVKAPPALITAGKRRARHSLPQAATPLPHEPDPLLLSLGFFSSGFHRPPSKTANLPTQRLTPHRHSTHLSTVPIAFTKNAAHESSVRHEVAVARQKLVACPTQSAFPGLGLLEKMEVHRLVSLGCSDDAIALGTWRQELSSRSSEFLTPTEMNQYVRVPEDQEAVREHYMSMAEPRYGKPKPRQVATNLALTESQIHDLTTELQEVEMLETGQVERAMADIAGLVKDEALLEIKPEEEEHWLGPELASDGGNAAFWQLLFAEPDEPAEKRQRTEGPTLA
eukprot:TRINITY_DN861_c0_g1_i1.p1 TRINITY_DN861_c0_g1~~TRINITY_DN861_c0_g1_i1.p1  ORF type:complete len:593 (+),score=74.45 TRINITY_DN861_c0_g1_i1:1058-2836(+)